MMVYLRKRLPESVVNDCNERIIRHGLAVIQSTASQDDHDEVVLVLVGPKVIQIWWPRRSGSS
jgi:hypothetical protein